MRVTLGASSGAGVTSGVAEASEAVGALGNWNEVAQYGQTIMEPGSANESKLALQ